MHSILTKRKKVLIKIFKQKKNVQFEIKLKIFWMKLLARVSKSKVYISIGWLMNLQKCIKNRAIARTEKYTSKWWPDDFKHNEFQTSVVMLGSLIRI